MTILIVVGILALAAAWGLYKILKKTDEETNLEETPEVLPEHLGVLIAGVQNPMMGVAAYTAGTAARKQESHEYSPLLGHSTTSRRPTTPPVTERVVVHDSGPDFLTTALIVDAMTDHHPHHTHERERVVEEPKEELTLEPSSPSTHYWEERRPEPEPVKIVESESGGKYEVDQDNSPTTGAVYEDHSSSFESEPSTSFETSE